MYAKTRKCIDCGAELVGHGKPERCRSCAAKAVYIAKRGKPAERIIATCEVCDKEFVDYASNRRKHKQGVYFCSPECRAAWVGIHNSISRGGDAQQRSKSDKDKLAYREKSDEYRERATSYYWKHRDQILERKRLQDREAKEKVVSAYGGKCECCGETMVEFLTVDHIKNDGAAHRRKVGKGRNIYKDLLATGYPKEGYRILCFNCNITRGFYGYCPHKPEEKEPISHKPLNPGRKRKVK